jgi:branched-chain amino acid transport system ATP-binding protein
MFPCLEQLRPKRVGKLSGGKYQMLAMERALMLDPDLSLLDEPSAALALILVNNIFEQIEAIKSYC